MIALTTAWILFTVAADWMAKKWGLSGNPRWMQAAAGLYVVNAGLWCVLVVRGLPMARGSVVFSCLGLGAGVVIGVAMGEHLGVINWIGVAMAAAAIVLVSL